MTRKSDAGARARAIVRQNFDGALSTLSVEMPGWPFGSIGPYVTDYAGDPVLLLSDLAQHSKNLKQDARACLLVREAGESKDVQTLGRVALMGEMHSFEADEVLTDRYLRYFPQARSYFRTHDFRFYRLRVERVRFIGGFGDIHWIESQDYRFIQEDQALQRAEASAVAHMNADHVAAMKAYCKHRYELDTEAPVMVGVDPEGFDLDTEYGRLRFSFPEPVTNAQTLRQAMVAMARPT